VVFPQTPLEVEVGLWIDGAWVDVTSDVYVSDKIVITRGRADEGARVDPGRCTLTFNNRLGKYSPRNPNSPYFEKIGRNTPLRVVVKAGTPFLQLPGVIGSDASTPDAAALDITGDIDLRIDAFLTNWLDAADSLNTTVLVSKLGGPSSDKSWLLGVKNNRLYFEWSADGVNVLSASSTVQPSIPADGRMSVRVTMDADNGAGGRTISFYTAPSGTAGTWTQVGDTVVQSGTTSIFNSTAAVHVGTVPVSMTYATGRIHAMEIRNGIDGTVVANPVFTAQALGATGFTDGVGRTWTLNGTAAISNRRARFIGEVSSWPSRWDVSGKDIRVPIEAAGILRRLGQGAKALDSSLRRRIPSFGPLAYWPMEEGNEATRAYSPIAGVGPLTLTGANWASADSLPSSKALPALTPSSATPSHMLGRVPAPASTLTSWHVQFVYRLDTAPAVRRTFLRILSTGTVAEWYIQSGADGTTILAKNADGGTVFNQGIGTGSDLFGQWVRVSFYAKQNGSNVDWNITWTDVGGEAGTFGLSFAGTVGRPTGVASPPDGYAAELDGMAIGHISAWPSDSTAAYDGAIDAWTGETAGARLSRLASEEGVPLSQWGDSTVQEQVGPQRIDTLLALFEDAADADGGILHERRNAIGLAYRDRISMYNQPVALALDYNTSGHVAPPLEPTDDDQKVRNDVTRQRQGGASARAVLEEGPLSVQAPPDGVGVYDESVTLNLYEDAQVEPHAYWGLHLGTVDEARYPVINLDLAAAPDLIDQATMLESGDRVQIANPPAWLPPGVIDQLMQGYQEVIGHPIDWNFQLNCTPASPWTVGVVGDTTLGRVDTDRTELVTAVDADATTLFTHVPPNGESAERQPWIYSAGLAAGYPNLPSEFPFDVRLGGEVVRATAIESAVWDAFGRTVSNGWGTSDSGHAWTVTGTAADYAVGSGYGSATQPTTGIAHLTLVPAPSADVDLVVDVATSVLATGASLFAGPLARAADNNNHYMARVEFTTAAAIALTLRKRVSGSETVLGTFTSPLSHTAGTFYRVRMQLSGTSLKAKIWPATGAEPGVWHIEATDSSLTAAANIGTRSFSNTGNTNTNPQLRFDNFHLRTPQEWTVTRSINGIVKAQTAGTTVSLAQPMTVAL
jgi:hypothetical protein